jgi:uncharacterized membrane protein
MTENPTPGQAGEPFRAVLYPHRSLSPRGFLILMSALGLVSFVAGMVFLAIGAWPVMGFFGLDVALVYVAFKLNYRSGRARELLEITPETVTLTRIEPSGRSRRFELNSYWARVRFSEEADGRTSLRLASHGQEIEFARFLTDDERREFALVLRSELAKARG